MTDSDTGTVSIGEAARQSGVSVSAIRYYESLGLVSTTRGLRGHRRLDDAALRRLSLITAVQQAGFSLDEVASLFRMRGPGGVGERHRLVASKLDDIREQIRRLTGVAATLERALACGCDDIDHCAAVER